MTAQGPRDDQESAIAAERAEELLTFSSSSLDSEMEHAGAWLRGMRTEPHPRFWEVEAVAGALGDLANAWGRLVLWARASGTYDSVKDSLEQAMSQLVQVRRDLAHGVPDHGDIDRIDAVFHELDHIHQRLRQTRQG